MRHICQSAYKFLPLMVRGSLLFVLLVLPTLLYAQSQNDSISLWFRLANDYTHEEVYDVTVKAKTIDGVYITSDVVTKGRSISSISGILCNASILLPRKIKEAVIEIDAPNFVHLEKKVRIRISDKEDMTFISTIYLTPKSEKEIKTVNLEEVKVNATKIKMVMRGDTLVYNADAFQLSQGSMLDELIRRLPGVTLKGNSIQVNGRFVSELLVNGEDFFRGDPGVALQNLPAYTVKNIKVFEKQNKHEDFMGVEKRKGEEPIVMDVRLKKEYMRGLLANFTLGGGTSHRWQAKTFAMRYSTLSRLAFYSNMNNTNDTRMPGSNGEWNPAWQAQGLTTLRSAGVDYMWKNADETLNFSGNTRYLYEKMNTNDYTSIQQFLTNGDLFSRQRNYNIKRQQTVTSSNTFKFANVYVRLDFSPTFEYRKNDIKSKNESGTFTTEPKEHYRGAALDSIFAPVGSAQLVRTMANRLVQYGLEDSYYYTIGGDARLSWKLPTFNYAFNITSNHRFTKNHTTQHSLYGLTYSNNSEDVRNKYTLNGGYSLTSFSQIQLWDMRNKFFNFMPYIKVNYSRFKGDNTLYRLDEYSQYQDWHEYMLHVLPSSHDSIAKVEDFTNSYHSTRVQMTNAIGMRIVLMFKNRNRFYYEPELTYYNNSIDYQRGNYNTTQHQRVLSFTHMLTFRSSNISNILNMSYEMKRDLPSLTNMLNITDDTNPLVIWKGNPVLKNTITHNVSLQKIFFIRGKNYKKNRDYNNLFNNSIDASVNWTVVHNAQGSLTTYNRATGGTITTPMNINGNWNITGKINVKAQIDKKKRWMLTSNTSATQQNSVDFVALMDENSSPRSSVRNTRLFEQLTIDLSLPKWYLSAFISTTYTHATSKRPDFITINAVDVTYGVNVNAELPWQVKLGSDLSLYSRYGYSDPSLNTNDLVWNARLSRTFGQWTFMADGFDLLGQLSNVRRTLNAQGRTETWHNTVPRYFMLSVAYRFHFTPKKKG